MLSTLDFHLQPHPTPTKPTLALLINIVTKISSYQVNALKGKELNR